MNVENEEIIKRQNQFFSNNIMCKMLSAAECYFNKEFNQNSNIFGYYNNFNSGYLKSKENLKKQFLTEIELFKNSYENFHYEYNKYIYPDNLSKNKIIQIVNIWLNTFYKNNNSDYQYYERILKILSGNFNFSLKNDIRLLNQGKVNQSGNVSYQLMNSVPYIQEYANNQEVKIKNDILNGNYSSNVHLNKNFTDNFEMMNIHYKIKRNFK